MCIRDSYWGTLNFFHVILPALLLLALFAAIWMARKNLGERDVKFALFWVIVPLLPVLDSRMLPKDEIVHDRYFYLPSVGAALLVALVVDRWTRASRSPGGVIVFGVPLTQLLVALVLAATLGGLSVRESQFWANNYTCLLYTSAAPITPGVTGLRYFYTDQTGVIRADPSTGATSASTPIS